MGVYATTNNPLANHIVATTDNGVVILFQDLPNELKKQYIENSSDLDFLNLVIDNYELQKEWSYALNRNKYKTKDILKRYFVEVEKLTHPQLGLFLSLFDND